jgi:hypothetical protein
MHHPEFAGQKPIVGTDQSKRGKRVEIVSVIAGTNQNPVGGERLHGWEN